jgi:hypothetical protein
LDTADIVPLGVVKRLLDALKADPLPESVLPFFLDTIEQLVRCSYNTEVHRSLALFITYTFHSPARSLPRTPKIASLHDNSHNNVTSRRPTVDSKGMTESITRILTKKEIGARILDIYSQLLCEKGNLAIIRKFAKTVTNKVLDARPVRDDPKLMMT